MKNILAALTFTALAATTVQANEITWSDNIREIFNKNCISCHGSDAPEYADFKKNKDAWIKTGRGMRMETYSHLVSFIGWPNTGALMRRLDDGKASKEGKPGNMYQHLGSNEQERQTNLALFKAWVGNWNLKRWADASKDELSDIKVKY